MSEIVGRKKEIELLQRIVYEAFEYWWITRGRNIQSEVKMDNLFEI